VLISLFRKLCDS